MQDVGPVRIDDLFVLLRDFYEKSQKRVDKWLANTRRKHMLVQTEIRQSLQDLCENP